MTADGTGPAPIPKVWRQTVSQILCKGDRTKIQTRLQSDHDWESTFPAAWDFDRFEALAAALEEETVQGRRINTMDEPGEVYAFWFDFQTRKLYGKINLLPPGDQILIYSNHIPRKGENL